MFFVLIKLFLTKCEQKDFYRAFEWHITFRRLRTWPQARLLSAPAGEAAQNTPPKTAETGGQGAKPSTAGVKPRGAERERRVS
jgi:hypothetical protein